MTPQDPAIQELLLDYALDRLDKQARRDLDRKLQADPELAGELQNIRAVLEPLDTWVAPPPPAGLVDDILERIEQARGPRLVTVPASGPAPVPPPSELRGGGRRSIISLPELVALAACITFFVSVFVPTLSRSRYLARRTQCGTNLASVFSGLRSYAQANNGALPNAGMRPGMNWLQHAPNRRNLRLIIRFRYVKPKAMVCPSRPDHTPLPADGTFAAGSIPDRNYISYDMQNVGGPTCNLRGHVCLPVVSDANPLFEGGRFHADVDPRKANTAGHRGTGQNVLRSDGHVKWTTTPVVGPGGDNIWTTQEATDYEGTEVQSAATDTFLIP